MERKKLFVTFTDSNIDIKTEDGDINIGIPYRFDIETGEQNLKQLLWQLGFDVEIKKGEARKQIIKGENSIILDDGTSKWKFDDAMIYEACERERKRRGGYKIDVVDHGKPEDA